MSLRAPRIARGKEKTRGVRRATKAPALSSTVTHEQLVAIAEASMGAAKRVEPPASHALFRLLSSDRDRRKLRPARDFIDELSRLVATAFPKAHGRHLELRALESLVEEARAKESREFLGSLVVEGKIPAGPKTHEAESERLATALADALHDASKALGEIAHLLPSMVLHGLQAGDVRWLVKKSRGRPKEQADAAFALTARVAAYKHKARLTVPDLQKLAELAGHENRHRNHWKYAHKTADAWMTEIVDEAIEEIEREDAVAHPDGGRAFAKAVSGEKKSRPA